MTWSITVGAVWVTQSYDQTCHSLSCHSPFSSFPLGLEELAVRNAVGEAVWMTWLLCSPLIQVSMSFDVYGSISPAKMQETCKNFILNVMPHELEITAEAFHLSD